MYSDEYISPFHGRFGRVLLLSALLKKIIRRKSLGKNHESLRIASLTLLCDGIGNLSRRPRGARSMARFSMPADKVPRGGRPSTLDFFRRFCAIAVVNQ